MIAHRQSVEILKYIISIVKHENMHIERKKSLVRVPNFACSVILPGQAFIQLTMQVSGNQKLVSIKKKECTDDMALWLVFLDNYNGKTVS